MAPTQPSQPGSRLTPIRARAAALGLAALAVGSCPLRLTFARFAPRSPLSPSSPALPAFRGARGRGGALARAAAADFQPSGEAWGAVQADEVSDEPRDYVKEVRELLRTEGQIAREQWKLFTDKYCAGCQSPRRVREERLKSFLEHYRTGYHLASEASSLRNLMEHAPALKEAWEAAVTSQVKGKKVNLDPNEYSEQVIIQFLENLVVDETAIPPRVMLARKTRLLIEEGIGGFEDEWADYLKVSRYSDSPDPEDHPNEVLQTFIGGSDPDLLDPEKGDLIYAVESFMRQDDEGSELWAQFAEKRGKGDGEFPDPRDFEARELERFMSSQSSRIQRRAAARSKSFKERMFVAGA